MPGPPAKPNLCYLIISPDPRTPGNQIVHNGTPGFFVKLGDGDPETGRYLSNNPSFGVAVNRSCPTKTVMTEVRDTVWEARRPGKFLEICYFKRPEDGLPRSLEWWWCTLGSSASDNDFTTDDLREELCNQLESFPSHGIWDNRAGGNLGESSLAELRGLEIQEIVKLTPEFIKRLFEAPVGEIVIPPESKLKVKVRRNQYGGVFLEGLFGFGSVAGCGLAAGGVQVAAGVTASGLPMLSVGLTLSISNLVTSIICFGPVSAVTLGVVVASVVRELRRSQDAEETGAST